MIEAAVTKAIDDAIKRPKVDPRIATFYATVPNAGIKTNRDNEWIISMTVAWEDRAEISRVLDHMPMTMKVTVEVVGDDE